MHVNIDRVFTTVARNLGLGDFSNQINNWIDRVAPFRYHICPQCQKGEIRFCFDTS